jgi:hypothetical protein
LGDLSGGGVEADDGTAAIKDDDAFIGEPEDGFPAFPASIDVVVQVGVFHQHG